MAGKTSEDADDGQDAPRSDETGAADPVPISAANADPVADEPDLTPSPDTPAPEPHALASDQHPGPAAAPAMAEHVEEEAAEEERGSSFAARALTFLLVLLAGAGLGIWAAPKVAPMLPAGLAPVAAWLTPGQAEAEARIAALETRLDDGLAAIDRRLAEAPDAVELEGRAQSLVSAAQSGLAGEIDALRATLAQSDVTTASERIGRLETATGGAVAELASLRTQIAEGAATGLSQEAAASVDTYRAELEGLRAEVGALSGSVAGLGAQLEEVQASAEARVTQAEQQAAEVQQAAVAERDLSDAQADIALIRAALAGGQPFDEPLARLAAGAGITPPAGLSAAAATGVMTPAALRSSYADAAHEAIRASIVASAGDGLIARSRAFLQAQAASRSLTPRPGPTPDAVLSRIEDALRRDDLDAALAEAGALPSEAAAAMSAWLAAAKLRADADAGLAEVSASLSTLN